MTVPANTFQTYQNSDNIAEDVDNILYNVDPFETPVMNAIPRDKAESTYTEWFTDDLAAPAQNAVIEGDDATTLASDKATRLGNYTQISEKTIQTSSTQEAVSRFGRSKEMAHQMVKKGKELKMDMELALIGLNNARAAGAAGTARELASVQTWLTTNTSFGATGADATGDGTDARTDGTQRAFTEALLKEVLESNWTEGGKANLIVAGAFNRSAFSGFQGNATQVQHGNTDKRIVATAKIYEGDYHTLTVIPSRQLRARDVLVLQTDMWALSFLQPFKSTPLAKTGHSDREMLSVEYTLKAKNEKSSGGVFDLTTS